MPYRILIVDDSPALTSVLQGLLESDGHIVETAPDASGLARARDFDLVLLDVEMPGVTGDVAAREITRAPGPRPIVLLYSGKGEDELMLLVRESGADGFLCKNLSPENLLEGIQRWVEHARTRHRVLLVDDSAAARFQARRVLDGFPVVIEEVHDGQAAVERCRQDPLPEIILLDVEMPVLDGFGALERLRAEARCDGVRIIMCTTLTEPAVAVRAFGLGCDAFLNKPFTREALLEKLQRLGQTGW